MGRTRHRVFRYAVTGREETRDHIVWRPAARRGRQQRAAIHLHQHIRQIGAQRSAFTARGYPDRDQGAATAPPCR